MRNDVANYFLNADLIVWVLNQKKFKINFEIKCRRTNTFAKNHHYHKKHNLFFPDEIKGLK